MLRQPLDWPRQVETIQLRCREPIQRILQHLLPRATDLRPGLTNTKTECFLNMAQNTTTYSVQLHSKLVGMSFWRIEHCLQRYLNQKDRSARPEKLCQVLFKEAISDLFDGFNMFQPFSSSMEAIWLVVPNSCPWDDDLQVSFVARSAGCFGWAICASLGRPEGPQLILGVPSLMVRWWLGVTPFVLQNDGGSHDDWDCL